MKNQTRQPQPADVTACLAMGAAFRADRSAKANANCAARVARYGDAVKAQGFSAWAQQDAERAAEAAARAEQAERREPGNAWIRENARDARKYAEEARRAARLAALYAREARAAAVA